MGLSEQSDEERFDEEIIKKYEDLCLDLNLDKAAKEEAWQSYERISQNYSLEGDSLHWLACALYVACRRRMPTVGHGETEGNCVSLTRMLRSAKLSLIHFFSKMKKWADMANLPQPIRDKVDRLERNFAVSTVIFKKFEPIFLDIFKNPADDPPKQPRSRKQRRLPCTASEVFSFCWTTFVQVKGNFPAISDDLVNSYHLLLCCIDWFYANALLSVRRDLLNPNFSGLPANFVSRDFRPPAEAPCLIKLLCEQHEGLEVEAKGIKEHWWKPHIRRNFEKKVLRGKPENLSGILEIGTFESNSKAIHNAYETYVLSVGDFDERIFLGEDPSTEIGTPSRNMPGSAELQERMAVKRQLQSDIPMRSLVTDTPLTGRRYLKDKEAPITPVSTATQGVGRLQALLSGRKTCPSDTLLEFFSQCARNPKDEILARVREMGEVFCKQYTQPSDDHLGSHVEFARRRLQLGESLYYKTLENIMCNEEKRFQAKDKPADFSGLLEHDVFHRSLLACCLEIVIFSYNSQRFFPWIVEIFDVSSYHFYKVIEILIRAEDGLSRDVVKHLNHIEEQILESYAWRTESPLWDAIREAGNTIPTCEEVLLPSMMEKDPAHNNNNNGPAAAPVSAATTSLLQSPPMMNPTVKRIMGEGRSLLPKKDPLQSPTGPSAADRFSSPTPGSARRRLFMPSSSGPSEPAAADTAGASAPAPVPGAVPVPTQVQATPTQVMCQQPDGRQVLITMQILKSPAGSGVPVSASAAAASTSPAPKSIAAPANKPKKTGSLSLFFRKVYHLASVRLRHLCEQLSVGKELQSQMWTAFEFALVHHIDLMQDRHLDQILMCSVYVMAKVTSQDRSFQDVMRCYRLQPQAQSHVYRSVLLTSRKRRTSGDTDSGSNSPVNVKDEDKDKDSKENEKKRADKLSLIRSTSTLPVPQPSSQPPTPTRLAGTHSSFESEDRGDLIRFYNSCFVKKVTKFAIKFAHGQSGAPPLSPLPLVRPHTTSPRRVSNKHSIYVSPHKATPSTAMHRMLYCFNRSPAKVWGYSGDLDKINSMIKRGGTQRSGSNNGKRHLQYDSVAESPNKRPCALPNTNRIATLILERQASNNEQSQ